MSPTSYQTAPPRVVGSDNIAAADPIANSLRRGRRGGRLLALEQGDRLIDPVAGLVEQLLVRAEVALGQRRVGVVEQLGRFVEQTGGVVGGAGRRLALLGRQRVVLGLVALGRPLLRLLPGLRLLAEQLREGG